MSNDAYDFKAYIKKEELIADVRRRDVRELDWETVTLASHLYDERGEWRNQDRLIYLYPELESVVKQFLGLYVTMLPVHLVNRAETARRLAKILKWISVSALATPYERICASELTYQLLREGLRCSDICFNEFKSEVKYWSSASISHAYLTMTETSFMLGGELGTMCALSYLRKSAEYAHSIHDARVRAGLYQAIGVAYGQLGLWGRSLVWKLRPLFMANLSFSTKRCLLRSFFR